jgi:hypothetical protein
MMTLGACNEALDGYSKNVSERVRWLATAGLAFVWVLAGGQLTGLTRDLLWTALGLVATLIADAIQYVIGWAKWELFIRKAEEQEGVTKDTTVAVPEETIAPIYWPFVLKLCLIAAAYVGLGYAIVSRLLAPSPVWL